jgi:hypothetical protein
MSRFLLLPAVVLAVAAPLRGDFLRPSSLRELAAHSRLVVRAEPLGPIENKQFRVTEVLLGSAARRGDVLACENLSPQDLQIRDDHALAGKGRRRLEIVEGLLFLQPSEGPGGQRLTLILGGHRFVARDGLVLSPEPLADLRNVIATNQAVRGLVPQPGLRWPDLLAEVRADCVSLRGLWARQGAATPAARRRGILAWIAEHRHEFSTDNDWGNLEGDLFDEVLATAGPAEGWAAVQLYAQLHDGLLPRLREPVFASTAGHDLLLGIATAEDRLAGDRSRALRLLGDPSTVGSAAVLVSEQQRVIASLVPLLRQRDTELCGLAARALLAVSLPETGAGRPLPLPMESLTAAYRAAPPGAGRNDLAAVLRAAGGPEHWQKVTGNPHGILGRLHDFGKEGPTVSFWLEVESDGLSVYEPPVLVLEQLNGGKVIQKNEQPVTARLQKVAWADGWGGRPLLVEVSVASLLPGTWRITPKGAAGKGKDRVTWSGEPQTVSIPTPRNPGYPAVQSIDW